jgi:hypothetical protein
MFSSVDKMLVAALGAAVSALVGAGYISAEQGVTLTNILVTLGGAVVTALVTYLVPNKS